MVGGATILIRVGSQSVEFYFLDLILARIIAPMNERKIAIGENAEKDHPFKPDRPIAQPQINGITQVPRIKKRIKKPISFLLSYICYFYHRYLRTCKRLWALGSEKG